MNVNLFILAISIIFTTDVYGGLNATIKNYQAVKAYQSDNLEKSRILFEDLVTQNPQDHEALYNAGKVLYKQQSFDKAEHYFNEVTTLQNTPDQLRVQALFDRSNAQVRQNKLQEALAGYEEIVKRMPDHAQAQDMIEQIKKKLEEQKKQSQSQQQKDQQQQSQEQKDKQSNNQNKQDKENSQQQSQSDSKSSDDQEKNNQEENEQEKSSEQNKSEQPENKTDQQKDEGSDRPDDTFKHDDQEQQRKQQHGQQKESKKTEDQEQTNQEKEHKLSQKGNESQQNKSHDKENKDCQQAVDQQTSPKDARLNEEEQYILKLLEKEDAQTVKEMLKASLKKETGQSHGQKNW